MLTIKATSRFQKDFERVVRRGYPIEKLEAVVEKLARGEKLPKSNRDHALSGEYEGRRECHIRPDWLLVYEIIDDTLILELVRTGTHSDLFGM